MTGHLLHSRINWPGILFIVLILLVWEIWARVAGSFFFPTVTDVAGDMVENWAALLEASLITLRRALVGFLMAFVLMLPLGIVLGRIRLLGDIVEPVIEFLRPLPPIAVVPLAIMVLGVGDAAKLVVVVWGASFPILVNTIDAVRVQDPMQARLARSLRLTTIERMTLIDLPAALPRIFAGIRLSITVALLLTVVSEIIVSTNGLGDYLRLAQADFSMARIVSTLIVIAILAVIVNTITNLVNHRLLEWHFRRSATAGL